MTSQTPTAPPAKKKHLGRKIVGGLILLVVLIAIISNLSSKGTTTSSSPASTNGASTTKASGTMPKIGQTALDGKFQFTVNSMKCGVAQVGSNGLTKSAQGQYCLLDISAKNIGNQSQDFSSENQYLYNASGQKFSVSATATEYNSPSGTTLFESINPGNSTQGVLVFDVPKGQTPTTAELHDSAFSGGVKISLQ